MKNLVSALVTSAVVSLIVAGLAFGGESYKISAKLTTKAEVPAPKGAAGATGTFAGTYVENKKGAVLTWKLSFSGLTGAASSAHIHLGKPGVAGGVLFPLCGPCKNGATGRLAISTDAADALEQGNAYANIHTAKNAGGEIRGPAKLVGHT